MRFWEFVRLEYLGGIMYDNGCCCTRNYDLGI